MWTPNGVDRCRVLLAVLLWLWTAARPLTIAANGRRFFHTHTHTSAETSGPAVAYGGCQNAVMDTIESTTYKHARQHGQEGR